jgi:hypothetical protein
LLSTLFSDCLLWLADSADGAFKDLHYGLTDGMNLLGVPFLAQALKPEADGSRQTPGLVVLPPIGDRVPLLHVAHGMEHDRDMLRMQLVVVGADERGHHAMAWRFESPEGPGDHCYWHCQPVRQLRGAHAPPLERLPDWHFDDLPTLPVAASNADELLVALLVSIYGHDKFGSMQRQGFQDQLRAQMAALSGSI